MSLSRQTPEEKKLDPVKGAHRLARIAYNSSGWWQPRGEAGKHESRGTYNARNKFGHEEWLFRDEWRIDGWRYAFIQGQNRKRKADLGQPLNVTLFTIQPNGRRRLVATIYGVETLNEKRAKSALDAFRQRGWFKIMQEEVRAIGGNVDALGNVKGAENVLNIRYRLENVDPHPPNTFLPDDEWIRDRHRYLLYNFEELDRERIERSIPGRRGTQDVPEAFRLFRRGTKPVEYTPEHEMMQAKLVRELQTEYGAEHVWLEQDFVDVRVEMDNELTFFEIKSDLEPRAVIRHALGQILEYAYHPARSGRRPDRLVIVGRKPLAREDHAYLEKLRNRFKLPLAYRVVTL